MFDVSEGTDPPTLESSMKRILLFVATNVAILLVLSVTLRLLGVDRILNEQGTGLDLNNLLVFSAVVGFAGSLISLAMSKFIAKRIDGRARDRAAAATPTKPGWSRPCAARPRRPASACPKSASSMRRR